MATKSNQVVFALDPRIRIWPDPALRSKSIEVVCFDEKLTHDARRLALFMKMADGQGIAAQQCGLLCSLLLVQQESKVLPMVNPAILERSEEASLDVEGCLSLPGLSVHVPRWQAVRVKAQDLEGSEFTLEAEGHLARVIQHEIDHLEGRLIIDYLPLLDKMSFFGEVFQDKNLEEQSKPEQA